MNERNWGQKGFVRLMLQHSLLKEVKRRNLDAEAMEDWCLLAASSWLIHSAFVEPSITILLVASPTMCCALSHGSLIGKMLHMLAYILILWSKFLSEVASSQTTLVSGDSS